MDSDLRIILFKWRLNPHGMAKRYLQMFDKLRDQLHVQIASQQVFDHPSSPPSPVALPARPSTEFIIDQWRRSPEGIGRKFVLLGKALERQRYLDEEQMVELQGIDITDEIRDPPQTLSDVPIENFPVIKATVSEDDEPCQVRSDIIKSSNRPSSVLITPEIVGKRLRTTTGACENIPCFVEHVYGETTS